VLLGGCASEIDNGQNSLDPQGPAAQKIFDLYMVVVAVAVLIGVAVVIGTVVIAIRFRYRPGKNENPKQIHGNTKLEIGWTILPALILAVIAVPTVSTIFDLAKDPGPEALEVTAVGKQWWWEFNYPGEKIVTANELVIPAGRPVKVHLTACEGTGDAKTCNVVHSFWVPELNGKKDVVPGHDNWTTIEADGPACTGQCAEC
jgi:cytochrome c oxidase subunit 2